MKMGFPIHILQNINTLSTYFCGTITSIVASFFFFIPYICMMDFDMTPGRISI